MSPPELERLGFTPALAADLAALREPELVAGRVVAGHQRLYRVGCAGGECLAELAGALRHASTAAELPAVGDWVALRLRAGERRAVIQALLPRRTAFVRRGAGDRDSAQVLAANVDTAFLVMGLDADFNLRRLERALVLAWESGARPVVLLNKADLCPEAEDRAAEVRRCNSEVPVRLLAAKPGVGLEALGPWLGTGQTLVLLGSSGVGKSTILNRLLGLERQATRAVRTSDQRGRHTTTSRELFELPGGALLIDTPGLREIQLWSDGSGLDLAFDDVARLASACRFTDCSHASEPGCAVRAAVAAGELAAARLASYHKLSAELRAQAIREDPLLRRAERSRWKSIHKSLRQGPRE